MMDRETEIEATMLQLVALRGAEEDRLPVRNRAGARNGPGGDDWRSLMPPVRRVAVRLAKQGRLAILRKGKPVADLDGFRGIYRLGLPLEEGE